jgi:hypothetical protein
MPQAENLSQDRHPNKWLRTKTMDGIHEAKPRETAGRETILRFQMQFQAAAFAALEILSDNEVDRIYCDYHDDFVVRRSSPEGVSYHFFQVKTKEKLNKQWTLLEVFALRKNGALDTPAKLQEIRDSIAGKLFDHTLEFGDQCREVSIISNIHFEDEVLNAIDDLHAGASKKKYIAQFIEKFKDILSPTKVISSEDARAALKKLSVYPAVDHIGESFDRFTSAARAAIWNHSEIDLRPQEIDEIARGLVDLVMRKSCERISGVKKQDLELVTSIGLKDLLEILSISTLVYETLRAGEDPTAIKSASILQRQLKHAGASDVMIETASRMKVEWDIWLRNARHIYMEIDLEVLLQEVDIACSKWLLSGGRLADLRALMPDILCKDYMKVFSTVDANLLFGAVCAAMVRRGAR